MDGDKKKSKIFGLLSRPKENKNALIVDTKFHLQSPRAAHTFAWTKLQIILANASADASGASCCFLLKSIFLD
jgi:hypothetical protein